MIVSTRGKLTDDVLHASTCPKGFPGDVFQRVKRKLAMIVAAMVLQDLASPPGNRLEALSGDRVRTAFHPHQRSMANLLPLDFRRV